MLAKYRTPFSSSPMPDSRARRQWLLGAGAALTVYGWAGVHASAGAQPGFPSRPIRLICPYGAGGPVDVVGRYMAACLQRGLGGDTPTVMENIPGGAGITGTQNMLRAAADGHTLLAQVTAALLTTQLLNRQAGFDAQKDFVPIWGLNSLGTVILVNAQSPYKSVVDLVEGARSGQLNYGSAGVGSTPHINTEMLARANGIRMTHVPYKSSAAAITDLMGGHIDCFLASIASSTGLIKEGKVRGLAVLRPDRIDEIGHVPTLKESGLPEWLLPPSIFALYTVAAVPADLRQRLADAAQKGLDADEKAAQTLAGLGLTSSIAGDQLLDTTRNEADLLRKTVAEAAIPVQG